MTLVVTETFTPSKTKPNLDMTLTVAVTFSPSKTKP